MAGGRAASNVPPPTRRRASVTLRVNLIILAMLRHTCLLHGPLAQESSVFAAASVLPICLGSGREAGSGRSLRRKWGKCRQTRTGAHIKLTNVNCPWKPFLTQPPRTWREAAGRKATFPAKAEPAGHFQTCATQDSSVTDKCSRISRTDLPSRNPRNVPRGDPRVARPLCTPSPASSCERGARQREADATTTTTTH